MKLDKNNHILVTGSAGFIGFHVADRLLRDGHTVVGLDNMNDYYAPELKYSRLSLLQRFPNFTFHQADIGDVAMLRDLFEKNEFGAVIHLAAQAGVRYSLENPQAYIDSNVAGFVNVLENCRQYRTPHLVYASSSSVYGLNVRTPFSEDDSVDHPISLYAATKKSNELMAHVYSHLFELPTTGLRFFTVYGPWGRPDMAVYKFTEAIFAGQPIDVYNQGKMKRDFTFIDDVVEGIVGVLDCAASANPLDDLTSPATARAPFRLYNIGNNKPVELMNLISTIEETVGKKAVMNFLAIQPGDMIETCANIDRLHSIISFQPQTTIADGIKQFVRWYKDYHSL